MKKLLIIPLYVLLSCGSEKIADAKKDETKKDSIVCIMPPPLNPNGDSELALLMREMVNTTQKIQDGLKNKTPLPPYPDGFGRIYFAKKTDPGINKEVFDGLANSYLQSLKRFYEAPEKDKTKSYNAMVNSCITCHENFCGGPIKRIKKFLIEE